MPLSVRKLSSTAARSTSFAMAVKHQGRKSRCVRFFITCPRVVSFPGQKKQKDAISSIRSTCRRSAILRLPSRCCEKDGKCSNYQQLQHLVIESEIYMVSSY